MADDETTQPAQPIPERPPTRARNGIPKMPQWAWALTVIAGVLTSGTGGSIFGASQVVDDLVRVEMQLEELEERLDTRLDALDDSITNLHFALIRYDPTLELGVP